MGRRATIVNAKLVQLKTAHPMCCVLGFSPYVYHLSSHDLDSVEELCFPFKILNGNTTNKYLLTLNHFFSQLLGTGKCSGRVLYFQQG